MDWNAFDAIYLINLPQRADRKRELERELERVGLRAGDPRLTWIRAVRPLEAGEFPSIGAKGCFLSHLACLQSAVEFGRERILIIEDDACFPRIRANDLARIIGELQNSKWDIWYGGVSALPREVTGKVETIPLEPTVAVQLAHCVAFQGNAIGAVRDFLQLILTRTAGHPEAGPMHVDGAYNTWRALNPTAAAFVTVPSVCIQRSSRSDIATTRWFDRTPVLRKSVAAFRRLRNHSRESRRSLLWAEE